MAEAPWRQAANPPPPPPGATGHIASSRLKSELSDRREPPLCVQNAMLTKDKKPFTYTPGGIDLSEIRSPRMARRLERNAMNEGVSSVPQTAHHHPTGPLPPSALAAMQPQLSVQVFPTGGIPQPPQCGPPPPPPPPKAPPMKTSPLPTDCYNRPDMTKIIPDNPMALLRKTTGPIVKQDPILSKTGGAINNARQADSPLARQPQADTFNQNNYTPADVQPRCQVSAEPPSQNKPVAGVGSIYVPPINQNIPVDSSPTSYNPPAYYKRQPSTPQQESPKPQTPDTPNSPKPSLSKAPTPWLTQRRQTSQDVPDWAVNDHRVQSPTVVQEQVPQPQREEPLQTKPVRPWQQQQQYQQQQQQYQQQPQQQYQQQPQQQQYQQQPRFAQQQPEMQQRYQEPDMQPRYQQQQSEMQPRYQQQQQEAQPRYQLDTQQRYHQQPQQFWQEQPQQQPPPSVGGARKQIQNRERPQDNYSPERTEVVIVNEPPQVYQHPGQRVVTRQSPQNSHQQYKQDDGVRIIPVQIEGRSNGQIRSPTQGANSDARSLNRQLSWNSSPTQSNTFRVLQKITQTDGADDDDQVVVEHSPKMYQQFPQRQASVEGRKWNQNESDQALMGTFKQVPQPHPNNAAGPKVRTIPIQIEGNGQTKNYVPPSEQTVQEPKKYMGSSIPSRSFKILQAMTAPDECVNPDQACENNENYSNDPSSYTQWGFDPNVPPPQSYCFDPYWSYYAQNYYPLSSDTQDPNQNNPRMTPIPAPWNFYPPYYYGQKDKGSVENKRNQRTTPLPWQNDESNKTNGVPMRAPTPSWPFYCPNYPNENDLKKNTEIDEQQNFMPYPPYWNPYYYNYYYGMPPPMYPPLYSPYPFYPQQSDTEEISGYSSNEEMAYYGARFASMPPFCNTNMSPRPKSSVAKVEPQPTAETKQEVIKKPVMSDDDGETSDSDAEMVSYEVCRKTPGLKAIRSVSDIKIYDAEDSSQCSDDDSDNTTEENDDNSSLCVPEDVIPHQLSVIFEESEKTDSVKLEREPSVSTTVSEGTATIENSEDEDADESDNTVFVKLPLTFKFVVAESQKVATITVGDSEIVPQMAVRSSIGVESCDKTKTDALFNTSYLENNKMNTAKDHEEVDWWGEISNDDISKNNAVEEDDVKMNELKNSESGIDFWAHLNRNPSTTQIYSMSKKYTCESTLEDFAEENTEHTKSELIKLDEESEKRSSVISSDEEKSEIDFWAEIINTNDNGNVSKPSVNELKQDASSTCSSDSSLSSSAAPENLEIVTTACNRKEEEKTSLAVEEESEAKPLTIQERIKSLQEYIASKKMQDQQETEIKVSIKERISQLQDNYNQLTLDGTPHKINSCSRKSSIKSYEGCSEEEEGDSGVTSDVSRHVSEVETDLDFFENKKMNQYQRASTHSRLFKLLQDECDCEDEPENDVDNKTMIQRRDCLSLPLKQPGSDPESFSSSGFTSPGSPTINDKIVNEIIQNLIMKKQGKVFKNMNMEKLQAAALRILQEDMDGLETLSSSEDGGNVLSPKKGEITNVPTAYTVQECYGNFNDYSQYYDSWSDAEGFYDGYDIVPSKAFRLLQEHSATNRTGAIAGLLARCPRVLSNKNVQKELMKLIESQNSPNSSPEPEQSPNVSEATSAS